MNFEMMIPKSASQQICRRREGDGFDARPKLCRVAKVLPTAAMSDARHY